MDRKDELKELRYKIAPIVFNYGLKVLGQEKDITAPAAVTLDTVDEILSLFAPELADAEKWRKLMSLFDISCDKCFLGHVCGTHRRSEAVCEDIKDALEGEGEKG